MTGTQPIESLVRSTTRESLYVKTVHDTVVVVGYWDDLDPEPGRTDVTNAMHAVARALDAEGYDVSEVETRYGEARVRVLRYRE
jgi:hypothetical protein